MNRSSVKWPVVMAILLTWASLLVGVTASGQGAGTPITVTSFVEILVTDNFDQGTATTSYLINDNYGTAASRPQLVVTYR